MSNVSEHLKDIDFRTREDRQKHAKEDFIKWYNELSSREYSTEVQAQLSMLSSVLWYLLPKHEYRRLVTSKKPFTGYQSKLKLNFFRES